MTFARWTGILGLLLCSLACPSKRPAEEPARAPGVKGSNWQVTSYRAADRRLVPVLEQSPVTLRFESEGGVTGSAGCNRFFASYELEGDAIRFGLPGATRMFCAEPEGLMGQEASFLEALAGVARIQRAETTLELLDESGQPLMRLIRRPE